VSINDIADELQATKVALSELQDAAGQMHETATNTPYEAKVLLTDAAEQIGAHAAIARAAANEPRSCPIEWCTSAKAHRDRRRDRAGVSGRYRRQADESIIAQRGDGFQAHVA
jgi:hypothetical protein